MVLERGANHSLELQLSRACITGIQTPLSDQAMPASSLTFSAVTVSSLDTPFVIVDKNQQPA